MEQTRSLLHNLASYNSYHLQQHRFKRSFQHTLNTFCSCSLDIETTSHYFLHCPLFHAQLTIFKILIFILNYYFFYIPGTHNSHGARELLILFNV